MAEQDISFPSLVCFSRAKGIMAEQKLWPSLHTRAEVSAQAARNKKTARGLSGSTEHKCSEGLRGRFCARQNYLLRGRGSLWSVMGPKIYPSTFYVRLSMLSARQRGVWPLKALPEHNALWPSRMVFKRLRGNCLRGNSSLNAAIDVPKVLLVGLGQPSLLPSSLTTCRA